LIQIIQQNQKEVVEVEEIEEVFTSIVEEGILEEIEKLEEIKIKEDNKKPRYTELTPQKYSENKKEFNYLKDDFCIVQESFFFCSIVV
jgi:hypothetical protein